MEDKIDFKDPIWKDPHPESMTDEQLRWIIDETFPDPLDPEFNGRERDPETALPYIAEKNRRFFQGINEEVGYGGDKSTVIEELYWDGVVTGLCEAGEDVYLQGIIASASDDPLDLKVG